MHSIRPQSSAKLSVYIITYKDDPKKVGVHLSGYEARIRHLKVDDKIPPWQPSHDTHDIYTVVKKIIKFTQIKIYFTLKDCFVCK